jgi:hypothetical protein
MRGSSPDCGVDKETLVYPATLREQKGSKRGKYQKKVQKSKTTGKEEEKYSIYLQQQQISY